MPKSVRRPAWLVLAALVGISLTAGVVLAHEGRPVGDYRFIVGWLEEPTYEGGRNAVSVRVNKVVEGGTHDDSDGHHEGQAESTSTSEQDSSAVHHATESGSTEDHDSSADHHATESGSTEDQDSSADHHATESGSTEDQDSSADHHATESGSTEDQDSLTDHGGTESGSTEDQDSSADHHATESGSTEDQDSSVGHHGPVEAAEDQDSSADHHATESGATMDHDSSAGHHGPVEAEAAMSVEMGANVDPVSGVNVHVVASGFAFAPDRVNLDHVEGEGHAHIYVDGVKVSRVYTPWYHLDGLEPGEREIEIRLNTNGHSEYTWNGEVVRAFATVVVPEPEESMGHHGAATVEARGEMSVSIRVEPDPLCGANLYVTDTRGFTFTPSHASTHHHSGEGYARIYVNDVKVARLYGEAFQLDKLAEGMNEVRVTLNTNDHSEYTRNGEAVQAVTTIHIAEGMGGPGYGTADADGGSQGHNGRTEESVGPSQSETGRVALPQGAGKPLASMAGQTNEGRIEPVEGLEGSLRVEVRHVGSGEAKTLDLLAVAGDPGHYIAGLIPTAPGVYEFRVFGDVEGMEVDETFASIGAGGGFDDVQTSAELQFPVVLPEVREIESGVRGAMQTAQQAQDAALAAQEGDGAGVLVFVALIAGIAGAVLGAAGVLLALRVRQA